MEIWSLLDRMEEMKIPTWFKNNLDEHEKFISWSTMYSALGCGINVVHYLLSLNT